MPDIYTEIQAQAVRVNMAAARFLIRSHRGWSPSVESAELLLALHATGMRAHTFVTDGVDACVQQQVSAGDHAGSWASDFDVSAHTLMLGMAFPAALGERTLEDGAQFLLRSYGNTNLGWSWSDEIGKTLLGLRALAAIRHPRLAEIGRHALPWLLNHQHDLIIVNERYTAEFLAVHREIVQQCGAEGMPERVREEVQPMQDALMRDCQDGLTQGRLWNNDARANGIALECMAPVLSEERDEVLGGVVQWFAGRQHADGSFGSALDTARVVQGLCHLMYWMAIRRGADMDTARRHVTLAHAGITAGLPLSALWPSLRLRHDTERGVRVFIVPDRVWNVTVWTLSLIGAGFLMPLLYDVAKRWLLES